ncbi:MAG: lysophospholipid acyltransferase family protein [Euzebya sp.]
MTEAGAGAGTGFRSLMRASHATVGPALLRYWRITVEGRDHVPATGGVILAANHRSFADHYTLGAASPRPMRFLGKAELAQGLTGRFNLAMGMIPVERGSADLAALDVVINHLRDGAVIGIFPEGTRSPTGQLFRFRSGMARVAAAAKVPIVPVGMIGMDHVWPRGADRPILGRPDPGVVSITFAAPIVLADDSPRARRGATAAVFDQVAALCRQPLADGFARIPEREG